MIQVFSFSSNVQLNIKWYFSGLKLWNSVLNAQSTCNTKRCNLQYMQLSLSIARKSFTQCGDQWKQIKWHIPKQSTAQYKPFITIYEILSSVIFPSSPGVKYLLSVPFCSHPGHLAPIPANCFEKKSQCPKVGTEVVRGSYIVWPPLEWTDA